MLPAPPPPAPPHPPSPPPAPRRGPRPRALTRRRLAIARAGVAEHDEVEGLAVEPERVRHRGRRLDEDPLLERDPASFGRQVR